MTKETPPETTLILGLGNIILSDEGFGIHVAKCLQSSNLPGDVKVISGGVAGFNLLGTLEGVKRVIVVDVMNADIPAGNIRFFKSNVATSKSREKGVVSFHEVGVPEIVQMWGLLGYTAEIYFLVTRPQNMEWGTELSESVQIAADKAVDMIKKFCEDNFSRLERSLLCT